MDAIVGLAIQSVGIVLVTILTFFMRGSIKSFSLRYWTGAWCCLSVSLASLYIGFHVSNPKPFYSIYFFGEHAFGLLFVAGCRFHLKAERLTRTYAYLFGISLVTSLVLPYLSADFNDLFMVQTVIMAGLFATSLAVVQRSGLKKDSTGLRVMSVALLLLTIDFLHYLPVFGARKGLFGLTVPGGYLKYTSIFDLILEILLGFGTVMVLMEAVRRELEAANKQLVQAHDKLELMAQMDPLTEALNRHAFHSLLRRNENQLQSSVSGCVAVIDIDNLKPINDSFGHNVGDKAIRAVARAVRSLIRADDMLFRWGGDEFLIIMFNLPVEQAGRRMESLNQILEQNGAQWTAAEVKVAVSFGMAGFDSLAELANAIELADKAMYSKRNYSRGSDKQMVTV